MSELPEPEGGNRLPASPDPRQTGTAAGQPSKAANPSPVDYFAVFGLPRKLDLDMATLERDFHQLSRRLHPDLHAQGGTLEQEWSLEQSSLLNDAYRTLRDPIQRTQYLLRLEGASPEDQSKAATEKARAEGNPKAQAVTPALLDETFELNLQLEEMRAHKSAEESDPGLTKELEQHKTKLEHQFNSLLGELKGEWREWDKLIDGEQAGHAISAEERAQARDRMLDLLNRRNYIRNMLGVIQEALQD